jgi:gliding motility-associated-like protein
MLTHKGRNNIYPISEGLGKVFKQPLFDSSARFGLKVLFIIALSVFGQVIKAQPPNNVCQDAIALTNLQNWCSEVAAFTNVAATPSGYGPATCFSGAPNDVWFSFVAEATDVLVLINGNSGQGSGGSMILPQAAIYAGICGGVISQLECQASQTAQIIELYQGGLTIGETYWIRVKSAAPNGGSFQLCINNFNAPVEPTSDCPTASILCDKSPFVVVSVVGAGLDPTELDDATCFGTGAPVNYETNSTWFTWICDQPGTLTFTLSPNNPSDDLDFVVYELPNGIGDCTDKIMLRCMASGDFNFPSPCMGPTGLAEGETDISEPAGCNLPTQTNFLAPLDMEAGKTYALAVNNFTATGNGFSVEWGGTGTFLGPQADFNTFPPKFSYCIAEEINFQDASFFALGSITGQTWFFGLDAVPASATGPGFHSVKYESAGLKTVALIVETDLGCQVTYLETILIQTCCDGLNEITIQSAEVTNNDCFGDANGRIDLLASSITTVAFDWDDGSIMPDRTNLLNGMYTVTLTNEATCDTILSFEITSPPQITADPIISPPTCDGGQDGGVVLTTSGGVPPYLYNWDDGAGFVSSNSKDNLPVGLILVTIRDANDCEVIIPVDVRELELLLNPNIQAVTQPSCHGLSDGSITIQVINGLPPYTYNFNNTGFGPSNSLAGLSAGTYFVEVRDANNCLGFFSFDIGQPDPLDVVLSPQNVSCFGLSDGRILSEVSGGTAPFTYQWSNGSTTANIQNLPAGSYDLTVTDSRGCTTVSQTSITQPPELGLGVDELTHVRCFGESNGEIIVAGVGGTPIYQYSLDGGPFQAGNSFAGLKAGEYTLVVRDELGCTASLAVTVQQPPPLLVDAGPDITIDLGLSTPLNISISPSPSGVRIQWDPTESIDCETCPSVTASPVNTTTYTITVEDLAGCRAVTTVTVVVNKIRNVYIPNSFSPNFDGINDLFIIYGGLGAEIIRELRIYNRWGGLIFEGFDLPLGSEPHGWDGTFKGRLLDPEVFAFYAVIGFIDGEEILYTGDIQLVR